MEKRIIMFSKSPRKIVEILGCLVLGFLPLFGADILNLFDNRVWAQPPTIEELFKDISQRAEATGSYHAEVTTVIKSKGKTSAIKGMFKFMWPNMRWLENRYPKRQGYDSAFIISNGSIRWNYVPRLNYALKYDEDALDESARLQGWPSADYFQEGSFQYVGRDWLDKDEMHVFEGEPSALRKRNNNNQSGTARMYVNVKTGILQKFIVYDLVEEEVSTQIFSHIQPDSSISAKDFDFTPPEGTKIQEVKDVGPRTNPE